MEAVSASLRRVIQESGRSLRDISRQAGVNHTMLSRFVRGDRTLSMDVVDKLCRELGLGLDVTSDATSAR